MHHPHRSSHKLNNSNHQWHRFHSRPLHLHNRYQKTPSKKCSARHPQRKQWATTMNASDLEFSKLRRAWMYRKEWEQVTRMVLHRFQLPLTWLDLKFSKLGRAWMYRKEWEQVTILHRFQLPLTWIAQFQNLPRVMLPGKGRGRRSLLKKGK